VIHKNQHIIPNCYLKSWCDPRTPPGQRPYIWRISRDGTQKKKKSPEKSFIARDPYTIKMPNGERNLVIETTLGRIEGDFMRVLSRIRRLHNLTTLERAHLCLFTAAMHRRTARMGEHWKKQYQHLHNIVVELEEKLNVAPAQSLETGVMVEYAHQHLIDMSIKREAPMLFQMSMTIMVTDDELGFVTSDKPCLWFNPSLQHLRPQHRHLAGLGQKQIEVTMPLTPQHLLLISHEPFPLYISATRDAVDEANYLRILFCEKEFVSWKGETRPSWFDV
jgi:hypothetical protein